MELQHTIAAPVTISDRGLFSGKPVTLTFKPAEPNTGILFVRTDLGGASVPATIAHVAKRPRRTALRSGEAVVETTEHCMSALAGAGVDNVIIEIDGPELPGFDGSAKPFLDAILSVGLTASQTPRRRLIVREPIIVRQDDAVIAITPSDQPGLQIVYELDYGSHPIIGRQLKVYDFLASTEGGDYATQIASARTFSLEAEARAMHAAGIGTHLTPETILVIGDKGPLGSQGFRYPDEPVRHKILDLIGDLYLLGAPIQGRLVAYKSGHGLNQKAARELVGQLRRQKHEELALARPIMDIRQVMKLLPHRYPMLLVDRIVELSPQRALGIKNVTLNEPIFTGHFPRTPVMPGVLIVEALAQVSGVLITQHMDHQGKIALLLSMDRVKLRRPVVPGDQLMLEAESIRIRPRLAHTRCRAYVGQELAAEAEVKFLLIDEESA